VSFPSCVSLRRSPHHLISSRPISSTIPFHIFSLALQRSLAPPPPYYADVSPLASRKHNMSSPPTSSSASAPLPVTTSAIVPSPHPSLFLLLSVLLRLSPPAVAASHAATYKSRHLVETVLAMDIPQRRPAVLQRARVVASRGGAGRCQRRPALLQRVRVVASRGSGGCYRRRQALLQRVHIVASRGGGCCYRRRPTLLQRAADPCCKGLAVFLPMAEAVAAGRIAARGWQRCFPRRRRLLPVAAGLATKGCRPCYKGLAASLPWVRRVAAAIHRRCY
jgi:hypothetical protein